MPRGGCSGGGGRRLGAGQQRAQARVARRHAARVHPSRARDASASRDNSGGKRANDDGDVPRSGRSRGRETRGGSCRSLGERILPGGTWCREDLGDAHTLHSPAKLTSVDGVSIAEEIAWRRIVGEGFDDLLSRPSGGGRIRDVEVYDSPAMVQQDHEHVEDSERRSRHDEEVD